MLIFEEKPGSRMKLSQPPKNQSIGRTKPTDWFTFVTDGRVKLAVPVGPRFQVDVPSWTPPSSKSCLTTVDTESDNSKWLGTRVWPLKGRPQDTGHGMVGRGRPRSCKCAVPGSIRCVRQHVNEKKFQLKIDLGPAFRKWKLHVMGEDACRLWSEEELRKWRFITAMRLSSKGKGFMKAATQCFQSHSKRSIIHYYLNVYLPRRICLQTRLKYKNIDTEDDGDGDGVDDDDDDGRGCGGGGEDMLCPKVACKRLHADFISSSRKYIKTTHMGFCR